ncbi:CRISPR-associated CARF protein Csa3 [Candidatus Alkanophaga liquidiphilum]|nr:putative transcriptional regulator [Candidatus Alkanophaga liquidiphilum]RLG36118.1 MAG: CRISPR locus-related DNA-binding protein [Candidatus Alkanophagales archaeon]
MRPAHVIVIGFHAAHIYKPLVEFGASKVVLVYSTKEEVEGRVADALAEARRLFSGLGLPYEELKLEAYEFEQNVELLRKVIRRERQVIVNLTGGRKITSFALLYAALLEPEHVKAIVYVSEDDEIIRLPKFLPSVSITPSERKVLNVLGKGKCVSEIAEKLDISLPAAIKLVGSLERKGLVRSERVGRKRLVMPLF